VARKNDRQRRQAREKHRRQQELRAARRRKVRTRAVIGVSGVLAAALITSLLLTFLPGGSTKHTTATPTKSPSASATASATTVAEPAHHCTYTKTTAAAARKVSIPSATPDYTASYQATISTNLGKLTLNLANSKATCTVNSFVHLAEAGYFNNTQCHRLTNTGIYVLQCGDPYATATTKMTCSSTGKVGTGGPGYEYTSENLTGASYPAGTLAMANAGTADSNGSQFFIVYKDSTSGLGATYTPFGTVSSGLGIVQNVAKDGFSCQYIQSGESEGGAPKEKVIIDSVKIKKT
jgi:peptidyl-prolyl cis-trans isomerase B (cyclophilin B)